MNELDEDEGRLEHLDKEQRHNARTVNRRTLGSDPARGCSSKE